MMERALQRLIRLLSFFTVKRVVGMLALLLAGATIITIIILTQTNVAILNPAGIIAEQQKDLIIFTVLLGMVIIVPVFTLLFVFAWRYRANNKNRRAKYTPESGGNKLFEAIWWGVPVILIAVLSVITWVSTHQLDPYKEIESDKKPLTIQVVVLEWKWLFIYPDQRVATINEMRFPEKTPINFEITADAPMSTFWIPNLGSQIYAMKGMTTKLSLMADKVGEYRGTNTNINGEGYSKMDFKAIAVTDDEFDGWLKNKELFADNHLQWNTYLGLVKPSQDVAVMYYHIHDGRFYDRIVHQYMSHGDGHGVEDMRDHIEGTEIWGDEHAETDSAHGMMKQMENH